MQYSILAQLSNGGGAHSDEIADRRADHLVVERKLEGTPPDGRGLALLRVDVRAVSDWQARVGIPGHTQGLVAIHDKVRRVTVLHLPTAETITTPSALSTTNWLLHFESKSLTE